MTARQAYERYLRGERSWLWLRAYVNQRARERRA